MILNNFLLVAAGGSLGACLRYAISLVVPQQAFPYATLIVNVAGSFLLGSILALGVKHEQFSPGLKLLLTVGICGGFTTFSGFSNENLILLQAEKYSLFFLYIGVSIVCGILATWLGFKLIEQ